MKTGIAKIIGALVATVGLLTVSAGTAEASAFGAAPFGPRVVYKGVGVSAGSYQVWVSGNGTYVNYVKGWPQLIAPGFDICNWNMTAEFFETTPSGESKWYKTYTGAVHYGCANYGNQATAHEVTVQQQMKRGMVCSTLKANGTRQNSVCRSIS